jgi:hypothetical protein
MFAYGEQKFELTLDPCLSGIKRYLNSLPPFNELNVRRSQSLMIISQLVSNDGRGPHRSEGGIARGP